MITLRRAPLSPLVRKHVHNLKPKWLAVTETASQLTSQFLDFAVEYSAAYREIKSKLSDEDVKRLNAEVGLNDAAATRLRQVAEANPMLRSHVKQLPPSFEALHAVAVLATEKNEKFQTAIKDGTIHPDLSVREARLLPSRRSSKKRKPAAENETLRVELLFGSRGPCQ